MKKMSWADIVALLLRLRAVLVLLALVFMFSVLNPSFFTANNFSILAKHIATSALLAIGMTFVILAGGIDLSVGSIAGLSGIVAGGMLTVGFHGHPVGTLAAIAVALIVSCIIGLLNGTMITWLGIAPFIATLGTLYIARGAALLLSNGATFPNLGGTVAHATPGFLWIGQAFLLGIPVPAWLMVIIAAIAALVARRTPFGRHVYAVGGNERAARLSGIRVEKVKILTYIFSSLCAGLVGIVIASQLEAAHPATGETFELNAIAAVVLGGTSLMGGRGSIGGSLIGACVISVLADGLVMMGVSEFWQIVIKGLVIVLAVTVDQLQMRVHARLLPALMRNSSDAKKVVS